MNFQNINYITCQDYKDAIIYFRYADPEKTEIEKLFFDAYMLNIQMKQLRYTKKILLDDENSVEVTQNLSEKLIKQILEINGIVLSFENFFRFVAN